MHVWFKILIFSINDQFLSNINVLQNFQFSIFRLFSSVCYAIFIWFMLPHLITQFLYNTIEMYFVCNRQIQFTCLNLAPSVSARSMLNSYTGCRIFCLPLSIRLEFHRTRFNWKIWRYTISRRFRVLNGQITYISFAKICQLDIIFIV